jgi:predicted ATPase
VGDMPQTLLALWFLQSYRSTSAENRTALGIAEQILHLAQLDDDPVHIMGAHRALGTSLHYMGEFRQARIHWEQVIKAFDPQKHRSVIFLGQDVLVSPLSHDAWDLWILGYPDQGLKRIEEMLGLVRELDHPFSLAWSCANSAIFHWLRHEPQAVQLLAEEHLRRSAQAGFELLRAGASVELGWAHAMQGQPESGIVRLSQGLDAWRSRCMYFFAPLFLTGQAEIYGILGKTQEGLEVVGEALNIVHKTEERWCEAEVHRVKGELLQLSGRTSEAEASFRQAIEVARRQEAISWELRATISLSRLLQKEGRSAEARQLLSEIYGWFIEGFDTPDLKEAKALLEELRG